MAVEGKSRRFEMFLALLLALTVLCMSTQHGYWLAIPSGARAVFSELGKLLRWTVTESPTSLAPEADGRAIYVTRAEVIMWIGCVLWGIYSILAPSKRTLTGVTAVCVVLALWPIAAIAGRSLLATAVGRGLVSFRPEPFLIFEYFLVGFLFFRNNLTERIAKWLLHLWLVVSAGVIVLALLQYVDPYVSPEQVSGPQDAYGADLLRWPAVLALFVGFKEHSAYAAYLAMVLPLFFALAAFDASPLRRIASGIMCSLGVVTLLSGPAFVGAMAAILVISMIRSQRLFLVVAAAAAAFYLGSSYFPHNNRMEIEKSFGARESSEEILLADQEAYKAARREAVIDQIRSSPLFGVGSEGPDEELPVPRSAYGLTEEEWKAFDSVTAPNPYLTLAAQMGVTVLAIIAWLYLLFATRALQLFGQSPAGFEKAVGVGTFGAVAGISITGLFTPVIAQGVTLPFVFLLAVVTFLWRKKSERGAGRQPEKERKRKAPSEEEKVELA